MEDKDVCLPIENYLQFKGLIGQANIKETVLNNIGAEFNKYAEIKVSGEQGLRKW